MARDEGKKQADLDGDGDMETVREDELTECGDMGGDSYQMDMPKEMPSRADVTVNMNSDGNKNITVHAEGETAEELAQLLKLSGLLDSDKQMAVDEEYANEPNKKAKSLDSMLHSGDDLHREKSMFKAAAGGDNPMLEGLEAKLWREFQKAKQK